MELVNPKDVKKFERYLRNKSFNFPSILDLYDWSRYQNIFEPIRLKEKSRIKFELVQHLSEELTNIIEDYVRTLDLSKYVFSHGLTNVINNQLPQEIYFPAHIEIGLLTVGQKTSRIFKQCLEGRVKTKPSRDFYSAMGEEDLKKYNYCDFMFYLESVHPEQ